MRAYSSKRVITEFEDAYNLFEDIRDALAVGKHTIV